MFMYFVRSSKTWTVFCLSPVSVLTSFSPHNPEPSLLNSMSQQLLPSTEMFAEHAMSPPKGELYALHVATTIKTDKTR